jgi:signal transduction histidine kinase
VLSIELPEDSLSRALGDLRGLAVRSSAGATRRGVVLAALGAGIGYFVGARFGAAFGSPTSYFAVMWPANLILVVALLLMPRRTWSAILGAGLLGLLLAHVPLSAPPTVADLYFLANVAQALLTTVLLQRYCGGMPRFDDFWCTARFIALISVAPAVVSLALAVALVPTGWVSDTWQFCQARLLTDIFSALTLLPPLLLLTTEPTKLWTFPMRRYFEAGCLALAIVVFGLLELGGLLPPLRGLSSLFYGPLALLLWAGIRFGVVGVSVSLLLLAASALWGTAYGLGPFAGQSPVDAVLDLQLFLIEVGVLVMLVAALVEERQGIVRTLGERNEEARNLAGKLITAQERERTRIARELHDEIGQSLTVVKINLGTMRLTQDATAQAQLVDEGVALVEQAIEQVRDLSQLLRPAILEHLGLEAALRWLVKTQSQRVRYQASFTADELRFPPSPVVKITCYRVLQEALTNVARHSRARSVSVNLRVANGLLRLRIRDDGEGFDLTAMRQCAQQGASIGLLSLDERARLANGRLVIISAVGQGTTLILTLPYPGAAPTRSMLDRIASARTIEG